MLECDTDTMAWSPEVFQLPIPPILFIIPPSHPAQWLIRLIFLVYTFTVAIPLITLLVPLSIVLRTLTSHDILLAIHPDNLPPRCSWFRAMWRGYMVYTVGTIVWAITGIGNAPESDEDGARWLTRTTCRFVEFVSGWPSSGGGHFVHGETTIQPLDDSYRIGALRQAPVKLITTFTLGFDSTASARDDTAFDGRKGKAILFLAGGGYVTGTPLAHPFIFSLARRLHTRKLGSEESYTIYAPNVRKSLDKERSFPVPLLDALAVYADIRTRYSAADIIVMGDSAGGGLTWSVLAYLAVLDKLGMGALGVPGRAIMISVRPPCLLHATADDSRGLPCRLCSSPYTRTKSTRLSCSTPRGVTWPATPSSPPVLTPSRATSSSGRPQRNRQAKLSASGSVVSPIRFCPRALGASSTPCRQSTSA